MYESKTKILKRNCIFLDSHVVDGVVEINRKHKRAFQRPSGIVFGDRERLKPNQKDVKTPSLAHLSFSHAVNNAAKIHI